MENKQKQIDEIYIPFKGEKKQIYFDLVPSCQMIFSKFGYGIIDTIYDLGYRKIEENAVVLTVEEYKTLKDLAVDKCHYDCHLIDYPDFEREKMLRDTTRKETAEKFAERLKKVARKEVTKTIYGEYVIYSIVSEMIDEFCKELGGE